MYAVASVSPTMAVVSTTPVARLRRNEDIAFGPSRWSVIGSTPLAASVGFDDRSVVSANRQGIGQTGHGPAGHTCTTASAEWRRLPRPAARSAVWAAWRGLSVAMARATARPTVTDPRPSP